MARRGFVLFALGLLWLGAWPGHAPGGEVVDRIVAQVGHHIILHSELEAQLALQAAQQRLDLDRPDEREAFREALLEQMIRDRLMLIRAERDTSVRVSDQEVETELDNHLTRIQSQFPSPEEFFKQLANEGLTLAELRRRYRSEVRNQLLKQKLIESKLRSVQVSSPEVDLFYRNYRDSLPLQPAAVHLADIALVVAAGPATLDSVEHRAQAVLDSLQAGADFSALARRHSGDPSAESGGDLGWFGRGVMVPDFERAAFGLAQGEISGLVRTRFGFHIIRSLERRADRVHAAHILFRTLPSEADVQQARAVADSIRQVVVDGGLDFAAAAKLHSADSTSAAQGGDLGWVPVASLQEPFASALAGQPAGAVLPPLVAEDGIHLVKVLDRRDERGYDLEQDRAAITEMARREKTGRVVEEWVQELRDEIYVEIRL